MAQLEPIVESLRKWVDENGHRDAFNEAVKQASSHNIADMAGVNNFDDYLQSINKLLFWVPRENYEGKDVYNHICAMFFVLSQDAVKDLQNPIVPLDKPVEPTFLSQWLIDYGTKQGQFLDTPESLTEESLDTFFKSPYYNMSEYIMPRGGWRDFNDFFARNYKPGYRPIAAPDDPHIAVSPADATFDGQWEIRSDSGVSIKGMHWRISQLLEGSAYKDRFTGGIFMHSFLNTFDYHRIHAPIGGRCLEARVIPGLWYCEVVAQELPRDDERRADSEGGYTKQLTPVRSFNAPDTPGFQFQQARGLVVLETPVGLVAVLPVGMAQISSVVLTIEEGMTVAKGEELSYFQFGGSDCVLVFERRTNMSLTAQHGVHYKMGTRIGVAYPYGGKAY